MISVRIPPSSKNLYTVKPEPIIYSESTKHNFVLVKRKMGGLPIKNSAIPRLIDITKWRVSSFRRLA